MPWFRARERPELSFDIDQRLHYDPSAPEPVPDESRDGRVRAKQAGIVPDNPLHSRHPWRSDARAEFEFDQRVSW